MELDALGMSSSIFDIPEEMLLPGTMRLLEDLRAAGADLVCHRHGRWELLQTGAERNANQSAMRHYVALDHRPAGWDITLFRADSARRPMHTDVTGFLHAASLALKAFVKEDAAMRLGGGG